MKHYKLSLFPTFALLLCVLPFPSSRQITNFSPSVPSDPEAGQVQYLPVIIQGPASNPSATSWPMVAGNPSRTSLSDEEVTGNIFEGSVHVEWYRPIEAYIPQNVQIIADNGLLFISTARGLYALNAIDGQLVWRYDTELPLGNSPTVDGDIVYVGGFDRRLHALNALTGEHLWSFSGALAGYSTNPLVVDGKVIAGNRDGYLYAIGAHNTPGQGKLLWKYKTDGSIDLSAAYKNGIVYFASNDNYAYALNASNGSLVWKSKKLIGEGFHSYWPVIYTDPTSGKDYLILSSATAYRHSSLPGTRSVLCSGYDPEDPNWYPCPSLRFYQDYIFYDNPELDATIGPIVQIYEPWALGKTVVDYSRVTELYEDNPDSHPYLHKPWLRFYIILDTSDGNEYTFDSDSDGYDEYAPVVPFLTASGNAYPPVVGSDNMLYFSNWYQKLNRQGVIMGWRMGTQYLTLGRGQGAWDEPQALSAGGNLIYRSICCDRAGDWFDTTNLSSTGIFWHYGINLSEIATGYDDMWWFVDQEFLSRLTGNFGNVNGIYNNHGDQNPIVPYDGRAYIHRSNAIIAFGSGPQIGELPLLQVNSVQETTQTLTTTELRSRLEEEVEKIISAGHLRPGYYDAGQFNSAYSHLTNYFENPGDTIYTLARAYPHLSNELQIQTRIYLQNEFNTYFDPNMYARTGWADGAAREANPLPPEVEASRDELQKQQAAADGWSWNYPQNNFYAMWKYAEIFPLDALRIYELAKSRLQVPITLPTTDWFERFPWEHNGYIAGYIGFLELQELAGMSTVDSQIRNTVINELDLLLQSRVTNFSKDTYYTLLDQGYTKRTLNLARNFMMLVPELGDYLNQHAFSVVQEAIHEYNNVGPYWFVSRYNGSIGESAMQNLYDYAALFQAKAYILKEPREDLTKYLDVPAFKRGDLFYIQNLIAAIEAE